MSTPDGTPDSTPGGTRDNPAGRRGEFEEDLLDVPHDDGDRLEDAPRRAVNGSNRIVGIDVARALALLGMMVVHLTASTNSKGEMPLAWQLSSGNAAALFATIAGIGVAFSTGQSSPPKGRRWVGAMVGLVLRAALIGALGLALGMVVPSSDALIILPYYAVLFVLVIPFLRFRAPLLGVLSMVVAVGVPLWSHFARQSLPAAEPTNLTFASLAADPAQALTKLLITGVYPALPWMAYLLVGLAIGRTRLRRWTQLWLIAGGTALALTASLGSRHVMQGLGGLDALAASSQQGMPLATFRKLLIWGADGTLPTDSIWWLGVLAPHTTTPFDLLYTMGISIAVVGASMMMVVVLPGALQPLATLGSMPLTTYSLHLLMLTLPFLPAGEWLQYAIHVVVLFVFALIWSRFVRRGPLEAVIHAISGGARNLIAGKQ